MSSLQPAQGHAWRLHAELLPGSTPRHLYCRNHVVQGKVRAVLTVTPVQQQSCWGCMVLQRLRPVIPPHSTAAG